MLQVIGDADLNIRNIVARWPGSTHDSRIFDNSEIAARFERNEIAGILIGDSGYPLRQYLITPLLRPQTQPERRYQRAFCRTRVKIENVFGIWKRRFPCLQLVLRLKLETSLAVIVACAVLHNFSRMNAVPMPEDDVAEGNVEVPVPQLDNPNQGGQAIRAALIRNFQ